MGWACVYSKGSLKVRSSLLYNSKAVREFTEFTEFTCQSVYSYTQQTDQEQDSPTSNSCDEQGPAHHPPDFVFCNAWSLGGLLAAAAAAGARTSTPNEDLNSLNRERGVLIGRWPR